MLATFFFSSRRRHTRWPRDWSSDVCSSDLESDPAYPSRIERSVTTYRFLYLSWSDRCWKDGDGQSSGRVSFRSEERRVGKEGRYGWWPDHSQEEARMCGMSRAFSQTCVDG